MTKLFRGLFALLLAFTAPAPASVLAAQDLPRIPANGCRSEMDARLAFGLCPDGTFDFYATGRYRQGTPRPDEILGYPIGSWHTTYGRMESYLDALGAAASDRVRVFDYGRSVERHTMHLVAVSSEANIARLDEIRRRLHALADPRRTTQSDADALIADLPVVVWLNAANDGNETAAFEAAMQIAYQLAAGEDARTRSLREGAVTLINLAHNPESHERHVAWYNAFASGDADPGALEHQAPWGMSTNNNHYQFDLNRDGLGLVQTESRAVAAEMQRWRPQVFVDLHGQTTQVFFPPAASPINPLYPAAVADWLETFGAANGAAFDAFGWSYYVRDRFDLYYPGYWDTYPTFHGATGMTFETDGGGSKGVRWRRDDGTILTFADGIAHHFVASLSTVETAVHHREARLRSYYDFFASAQDQVNRGQVRLAIIVPGHRPSRVARLVTTLLRHGLEVQRTTAAGTVDATDYLTDTSERRDIPAGSYLVDFAQPNARLAAAYLLPDVPVTDEFAAQELARWARNARRAPGERERYTFYDVNAWNLVLASGVTGYWATSADLPTEPVPLPDGVAKAKGGWQGESAWPRAGGTDGRARSAYVWPAGDQGAYRLLARLLDEDFNVAWVTKPMVVDGVDYKRGTFIARVGRNAETLHARIDALARDAGVSVTAAASAFPDRGSTGSGSEDTRSLKPPRIGVLAGEGVSITSYAALWFELEQRLRYPFTAMRADRIAERSLEHFDVIVLPSGAYQDRLGEGGTERLAEWVRSGGTLVAYGRGARFVMDGDFGTSHEEESEERPDDAELREILAEIDAAAPAGVTLPPSMSPEARPDAPLAVPGAFLRGVLDRTHWLTAGYEREEIPLLMRALPLRASQEGTNAVIFAPAERLVMAGFTWPHNTERSYAGKPYATVDPVGEGTIVLLAGDPLFRGVFDAPAGLLYNAIFLGAPGRPDAQRPRG